jgi:hypothetical protein
LRERERDLLPVSKVWARLAARESGIKYSQIFLPQAYHKKKPHPVWMGLVLVVGWNPAPNDY